MAPPPLTKWRVLKRTDLTHDVFELLVERPQEPSGYEMKFRGGQYISIVIPGAGPGGRNLRRAYSIASPPESRQIELCIKKVEGGPGTTYLGKLREGDVFEGQAPFGDFFLEHDLSLPTMFIGTGTGLAPLRSMILSGEWRAGAPVAFLLGVRAEKDIIYPELFGEDRPAALRTNARSAIALSRPEGQWSGFRGRVTDYLRELRDWDFKSTHYYLCGSGAMIAEVKEILAAKSVDPEHVHTEKYF